MKQSAWKGLDGDLSDTNARVGKKRKRGEGRRWTKRQMESVIQASEAELERGLKERNVVEVDGTSQSLSVPGL